PDVEPLARRGARAGGRARPRAAVAAAQARLGAPPAARRHWPPRQLQEDRRAGARGASPPRSRRACRLPRGLTRARPTLPQRRGNGRAVAGAALARRASENRSTARRAGSTAPRPTPRRWDTGPAAHRSPAGDVATTTARRPG